MDATIPRRVAAGTASPGNLPLIGRGPTAMSGTPLPPDAPRVFLAHHDKGFLAQAWRRLHGLRGWAHAVPEAARVIPEAIRFRPDVALVSDRFADGVPRLLEACHRIRPDMDVIIVTDARAPAPGQARRLKPWETQAVAGSVAAADLMRGDTFRTLVRELLASRPGRKAES